jgi:hypothetical protein
MERRKLAIPLIFWASSVFAPNAAQAEDFDRQACRFNGFPLYGDIQVVESFPDIKVQIVDSFPDLNVQEVTSFPDDCGQWKFVTSFPDVKIQYVTSFPDIKIKMVTSFPGWP